jgi:hypothetical protein
MYLNMTKSINLMFYYQLQEVLRFLFIHSLLLKTICENLGYLVSELIVGFSEQDNQREVHCYVYGYGNVSCLGLTLSLA